MAKSRLGSPQPAGRRVAIAKPKNDVYVVLLAIAVFALVVGCVLLFMEFNEYGRSVTPNVSQVIPGAGSSESSGVAVARVTVDRTTIALSA